MSSPPTADADERDSRLRRVPSVISQSHQIAQLPSRVTAPAVDLVHREPAGVEASAAPAEIELNQRPPTTRLGMRPGAVDNHPAGPCRSDPSHQLPVTPDPASVAEADGDRLTSVHAWGDQRADRGALFLHHVAAGRRARLLSALLAAASQRRLSLRSPIAGRALRRGSDRWPRGCSESARRSRLG